MFFNIVTITNDIYSVYEYRLSSYIPKVSCSSVFNDLFDTDWVVMFLY